MPGFGRVSTITIQIPISFHHKIQFYQVFIVTIKIRPHEHIL